MRKFIFLILISLILLQVGCVQPQTEKATTEWLNGHVTIALTGEQLGKIGWINSHQLGLRSDGVLVYRKTEEE